MVYVLILITTSFWGFAPERQELAKFQTKESCEQYAKKFDRNNYTSICEERKIPGGVDQWQK